MNSGDSIFGVADWAYSVDVAEQGTMVTALGQDSSNVYWDLVNYRLDNEGNALDEFRFEAQNGNYSGGLYHSISRDFEGHYYFFNGGQYLINDTVYYDLRLWKFNVNGDSLWSKSFFQDTLLRVGNDCIVTSDGGVAAVGAIDVGDGTNGQAYILKTDADGNMELFQTYGNASVITEEATSIVEDWEGGFIVGGRENPPGPSNSNHLLFRTDSLGNLDWYQTIGLSAPYSEGWINVNKTSDGNYIYCGAGDFQIISGQQENRGKVVKIDISGNEIWTTFLGPHDDATALIRNFENSTGQIIAVGVEQLPNADFLGSLVCLSQTGDSLWYRTYSHGPNGNNILSDVIEDEQGYYVMCGMTSGESDGISGQDAWVIRVDEWGCLEPGCHLIDDLEEINIGLQNSMKVFPNPVQDVLHIEWSEEAAISRASMSAQRGIIIDQLGRTVRIEKIPADHSSTNYLINLSSLPAGHYTLHWMSESIWYDSVKFVKE